MPAPLVVYVDVDDTLVRHAGSKQVPIPTVIAHVRELHDHGAVLYCWSTGGADYARSMAEAVGLEGCFAGFLPKPNVIVDDQAVADWRGCVEVTPNEVVGRSAADHEQRLRNRP